MSEGQHRQTDGPVVSLTGARFGGAAGRRVRQVTRPEDDSGGAAPMPVEDQPVVGQTGARFAPAQRRRRARPKPDQEMGQRPPVQPTTVPALEPGEPPDEATWAVDEADWDGSEESYGLVRPYAWTKGRTESRHDLALEALISATGWNLDAAASPEHLAILQLCTTPRSVAEVAALLSVPLGVARVVLGDMAETGSVLVHRTAGSADAAPDLALMQRVLSCLQRL